MASGQNQKSQMDYSISFEDVSKLFSLPLSEAADILGVSTSVLKKICNENGLERWPHRKYLSGKSIEDIKKEAAKEKNKALVTSTTPKPGQDMSDPQGRAHYVYMAASSLGIDANAFSDEFKYGFPSNGLSEYSNKWWGNDGISKNDVKSSSDGENSCEVKEDDRVSKACEERSDKMEEDLECDKIDGVSLSVIRKRAVEEGKKSIKFGVLKNYGADKLGNEEKILLRKLFQTS